MTDKAYSTGEAAKLCNVGLRVIVKWFDSGSLKGYKIPGTLIRKIPERDLVDFMRVHGMPIGDELEEKYKVVEEK